MQNVSDWALHAKGVAHIGLLKFELGIPFEMAEIFRCAGDEIVEAQNFPTFRKQTIAKM